MGKASRRKAEKPQREPQNEAELQAEMLEGLTPDQVDMFMRALELTMKKRRWLMIGYIAAIILVLVGMLWAMVMYGNRTPGSFIGWVFLLPPALGAGTMLIFGKIVRRMK